MGNGWHARNPRTSRRILPPRAAHGMAFRWAFRWAFPSRARAYASGYGSTTQPSRESRHVESSLGDMTAAAFHESEGLFDRWSTPKSRLNVHPTLVISSRLLPSSLSFSSSSLLLRDLPKLIFLLRLLAFQYYLYGEIFSFVTLYTCICMFVYIYI